VEFARLTNFALVREVLTHPAIYPLIGDDYSPPVEEFRVNEHPEILYLAAWARVQGFVSVAEGGGMIGMFTLLPQNRVCWEVHVVMLPWASKQEKWEAARCLPAWLARHTPCRRLTAAVPSFHWPALIYGTHGIGMKYVGRQEKAFMKGGQLRDLIILGLSIGG
jgi:hypothetical protein